MTGAGPRVLSGRYRLGARLGGGGMADVYAAVDERLHRNVAVKLFRTGLEDEERQDAEVRLLASLNHPGLVGVYDAELGDPSYVVMELVDGQSLDAALRAGQPLDVRRIGAEVAAALAYVHEHGVVHRDVKPGNVLLARDGRAKLADFGIARLVDQAHLTRTGQVMGTAAYLAPEQVRGEAVSGAADVYSLGLVLLEALTGRREFEGNPTEAAVARLSREPVVPPTLPADLRPLLVAMTDRDPARRPAAATVAARLRSTDPATVALAPVPAPAATQVLPAYDVAVAEPVRRSPWGWWVAAIVVVAALTGLIVALVLTNGPSAPGPAAPLTTSPTTSSSSPPPTTTSAPPASTPSSAPPTTATTPAPTTSAPPTTVSSPPVTLPTSAPSASGSLLSPLAEVSPTP